MNANTIRRTALSVLAGALPALLLPAVSHAQPGGPGATPAPTPAAAWPNRQVRMLVGATPGGGTDQFARAIADQLGPALKVPVVVENRPGASNTIAADVAARSTDGHTMVMGVSTAHAIAPHLLKLQYDNMKDLAPIAFVGSVPNVLVVAADSPAKDVRDLIAMAKRKGDPLNYGSSGAGSTQHIAAELFADAASVSLLHIPYKGSAPALLDLMGGRLNMIFDTLGSVLPLIESKKVRALAVLAAKRHPKLPNVPTLAEAGVPGVEMGAWYGIYMPSTTPAAVQQRVHQEVNRIIGMPETRSRLEAIGAELSALTQAQFAAFHEAENRRYSDLIRKRGISVD
jgi:tripartite-type tricarboxylate transporter receptor subunit TctC